MRQKIIIALVAIVLLAGNAKSWQRPLQPGEVLEVYCKNGAIPHVLAEHGRVRVACPQ